MGQFQQFEGPRRAVQRAPMVTGLDGLGKGQGRLPTSGLASEGTGARFRSVQIEAIGKRGCVVGQAGHAVREPGSHAGSGTATLPCILSRPGIGPHQGQGVASPAPGIAAHPGTQQAPRGTGPGCGTSGAKRP